MNFKTWLTRVKRVSGLGWVRGTIRPSRSSGSKDQASMSDMKPFLMGSETEYSVSGSDADGPRECEHLYNLLNHAIRQDRLWLADVVGRQAIYLENGSRFYLDYGGHPEYATPECLTPQQIACHDKAGELILQRALAQVRRQQPDLDVTVLKNNLNAVAPHEATWGTHESYTSWVPLEDAGPALVPHLVSRIIYAGAGCLSHHADGVGFELSQRARHLVQVISTETTRNRAIFCTRLRKVADSRNGWVRAHLIGKDSQRAPFGIYLTFGTTGLLFLLLNARRPVGAGLTLADPLAALRTFSHDPWLRARVPLVDGRQLSALEIQESYLAECEFEVHKGGFPDWAFEVIRHWRETLATLAKDPLRMAGKLDAYCKLLIFDHELRRAGLTWHDLRQNLQELAGLRAYYKPEVVRALLLADPSALPPEKQRQYADAVEIAGVDEDGKLERLRLAVRLVALDAGYHEVGGLYDKLAAAGHIQPVVLTQADIEAALWNPPAGSRAAVRGQCIKSFRDQGWVCEWRYLYHAPSGDFVDLRDPFGTERRTVPWKRLLEQNHRDPDILDISGPLSRR